MLTIFFFATFFFCEFVDKLTPIEGKFTIVKVLKPIVRFNPSIGFLNKHQIEIQALKPIIKELIVFRNC